MGTQMPCTPIRPLPSSAQDRLTASYKPFTIHDGDRTQKVYARKLYGFENAAAFMSETGKGFTTYTGGVSVRMHSLVPGAPSLDRQSVLSAIQRSWVRARHLAPSIACRTFGIPDPGLNHTGTLDDDTRTNRGFYLVYEVACDNQDAEQWACETVVVHPASKGSLRALEAKLSGDYWKPGDSRYCLELHVAEDGERKEWLLFLHGLHCAIDGRCSFMLLDQLISFVMEDLSDPIGSASSMSIAWGTEAERLLPASGLAIRDESQKSHRPYDDVSENAHATRVEPQGVETPGNTNDSSPASAGPFLRPLTPCHDHSIPTLPNSQYEGSSTPRRPQTYPNVYSTTVLSREKTAAFRAACKLRGRSVTTVVDAILVLSEVEAVMRNAAAARNYAFHDRGDNRNVTKSMTEWVDVKKMYDEAGGVPVPLKFVDMRPSMPANYATLCSEQSTPLFALHPVAHLHPMDNIRKAILVTDCPSGKVEITVDASEATFWDGVVRDSAELWKNQRPSPNSFAESEAAADASLPHSFNPAQLLVPATVVSCPGDFDALGAPLPPSADYGVLGRWNEAVRGPVVQANEGSGHQFATLGARVNDITLSVRTHKWPMLVWECFQYNGRLTLHLFASSGWYSQDDVDELRKVVSDWVSRVCKT